MPGCAAYGCSNRSENGFSLKVFPRDPERRALWSARINRKNWTPTNTSYICEKHFAEDQWEVIRVDGKKKLKANAVPTIFEISKKRNSNIKKKRGRKCKLLGNVDNNDTKENFENNTETLLEPSECFVCCFPLENGHEVNLDSLTKTSGVTIHERLTSISGGEAVKLQSCKNDSMDSLCMRCAHLVNYVDRMEAELALLKGAISSCLKNFSGDNQKLDAEVKSHVLVLDQFEAKLLGQNLDNSKEKLMKQNPVSFDADENTWSVIDVASVSEKLTEKNSSVSPKGLSNGDGELPKEGKNSTGDKEEYQCRICLIRTHSRSVLFFHLRKHMATYQWCDFCDIPLKSIEDEVTNRDNLLCEVNSEVCNDIL